MKVSYTCFEVSSVCNMGCKFCFANWRENKQQLPLKKVLYIIDKLKENGLEAINITGGEALLREDIIEICKYCQSLGLITILSTNGIELLKKEGVLNYIDSVNLPLDSYISYIHNDMRPCKEKDHHKLILNIIDFLNINYPKIKIKINTMVSKKNKNNVMNIGELIEGKVFSWKLSKFLSSGYGENFKEDFEINEEDFIEIVNICKEKYEKSNIIEEDYRLEENEVFDLFIDGYGKINLHTIQGIRNYGEIDKLNKLETKIKNGLNKEYLEQVYK